MEQKHKLVVLEEGNANDTSSWQSCCYSYFAGFIW